MGDSEARLKVRENAVAWQQVEGETILLDVATSSYLGVNESGSALWPALVEGATRTELIARLVAEYSVDADQAAADVDSFVEICRERGFLEA